MKRGRFIVIDGINGCGKGTQIDRLTNYIRSSGKAKRVLCTGEPNDMDENGEKAREILKKDDNPYENALEAVGYFAKNRKNHNSWFVPQLTNPGVDVISDRYWHSNFAFQNAQGVSFEDIAEANKGSMVPDLTIIIDVPAKVAVSRLEKRDGQNRRKFDMDADFLESVRDNYLDLPDVLPGLIGDNNVVVINGDKPTDEVWGLIKEIFDETFSDEGKSCNDVESREIIYSTEGMSEEEKAATIRDLEMRYGVSAVIR